MCVCDSVSSLLPWLLLVILHKFHVGKVSPKEGTKWPGVSTRPSPVPKTPHQVCS